jgi:hypothetical protein
VNSGKAKWMMQAPPISGEKLTTWSVVPGGQQVSLDFVAADGRTQRLVLPVDVLSGLMMTLPRMLQSALDERFPDGAFRIVQRLETWRLEQQAGSDGMILRLGTSDGFEVAFAIDSRHIDHLGAALLKVVRATNPILVRRPN